MPTPTDHDSIREPFRNWLADLWPDAEDLVLGEFGGAATGYSAQTLIVPVQFRRGGEARSEKVVLRIENLDPPIYPQQSPDLDVEIDIQYRTMESIAKVSKLPLAGLIAYEADASILGAPFFVMEFVAGETPIVDPPYPREGFFAEAGLEVELVAPADHWEAAGDPRGPAGSRRGRDAAPGTGLWRR